MPFSGTVTVLAADREFRKRRFVETTVPIQKWTRLPAVASNASRENWPLETIITELVAWRELPLVWLGIERKGRFEEIFILLDDRTTPVRSRSDDPFHITRLAKDVLSARRGCVLALVETPTAGINLEVAIQLGIKGARG